MDTIQFRLDENVNETNSVDLEGLREQLERIRKEEGTPVSFTIRKAVREYLERRSVK